MSQELKSDSINFEDEQIEQKTLNSDEHRKLKQDTDTKSNNKAFNKAKSSNKFPNKSKKYKINLPLIYKYQKNGNSLRKETNQNEPHDSEGIFLEINKAQKKIKGLNKELKSLKREYNNLIENNMTNKFIIEKILEKKNESDYETNLTDEGGKDTEKEDLKNKNNKSNKKSKKKFVIQSDERKKIYVLKKLLSTYDNDIKSKEGLSPCKPQSP